MRLAAMLLLLCHPVVDVHGMVRHDRYRSHDGSYVRRPHLYRRHPNQGTAWTAVCKDGAVSFSHTHAGICGHHGGVRSWH